MIGFQAHIGHVPALASILWSGEGHSVFGQGSRGPVKHLGDLLALLRAVRRGWVHGLRDGHRVLGFVLRDEDQLHAIYVHPEAQRRGVGTALMTQAQSMSPRLELWCLQANHGARNFYHKQGFSVFFFGRDTANDAAEGHPQMKMVWQKENSL